MFDDLLLHRFKSMGRGPDIWDCYGLCIEVFKRFKINVPTDYIAHALDDEAVSKQVNEAKSEWVKIPEPVKPCLITFSVLCAHDMVNHVGVYIGGGRFIHCMRGLGVTISPLAELKWRNSIEGYYVYRSKDHGQNS